MSFVDKALSQGWRLDGQWLTPPDDHEASGWAAEWIRFQYKDNTVIVPHWLPRVLSLDFLELVEFECTYARKKFGSINSLHEGYGVLCEEVDEFFEEVRKKKLNKSQTLHELVQVAAAAKLCAEDCLS